MIFQRSLRAIVLRDLRVLMASPTTAIPMIALPVLFFAGLPLLVGIAPQSLNLPIDDIESLVAGLPAAVAADLPADPQGRLAALLLVTVLAPLFLVVPLMLAVLAAAGAIAGERERRTLETLLLSPVTDRQLYIAKTAGAWVPAVAVTLIGAIVYQVAANWVLAEHGVVPFPNATWTILTVWVAPALAAAALGAVVTISARSKTFQGALQASGVLVLPIVAMMAAQVSGLLVLGPTSLVITGAVLWMLAGVLLPIGGRAMRRDSLAARL